MARKLFIITVLAMLHNCAALQSRDGWPCQSGNWTDPVSARCSAPIVVVTK